MAGLDENVLFLLTGESYTDSSYNKIAITNTKMMGTNIENEEINGHPIRCINFNTASAYLTFNLDDRFFNNAWTIDWWEKDSGEYPGLSGLFTNMTSSSGSYFGIGKYTTGNRTFVNMAEKGSYFINTEPVGRDITNTWVHRAIVFDGVNTYSFYENGVLYNSLTSTKKSYNNVKTFQMGRWRTNTYALCKKIYNFRVSNCARYTENFTPQVEKYDDRISKEVKIDGLDEASTLYNILDKVIELKEGYETLRLLFVQALKDKGLEVDRDSKFQALINHIQDLMKKPVPSIYDNEPKNPFGNELHSKIRYRDRDGLDRVVYSKVSNSGYPCFLDTTSVLYFATKATYVQAYVYKNNAWEAVAETYYGQLAFGSEIENVYSNSTNIIYHSSSSKAGQLWKAKAEY